MDRIEVLFEPAQIGALHLCNRIAMAPMTRGMSPGGIPGDNVAAYCRRRAEGGVGLIMTEGTWVPRPSASNQAAAPRFYGEDALANWQKAMDEVHAAGGRIMAQLAHVGQMIKPPSSHGADAAHCFGPSGMVGARTTEKAA